MIIPIKVLSIRLGMILLIRFIKLCFNNYITNSNLLKFKVIDYK